MKSLKIVSILVLAVFSLSFGVSGVYAIEPAKDWKLHVKTVQLNETFTVAPSGFHIPEASFSTKYNKNYLNLVSTEGNSFTFKAVKPGITYINIILTPWYHILIYPPVDDRIITDTYVIIIKK